MHAIKAKEEDEDGVVTNTVSLEVIKALVNNGANIEARDKNGWTPLMLAIQNENTECVEFLLRRGAKKDVVAEGGYTPADLAEMSENSHEMKALLAGDSLLRAAFSGGGGGGGGYSEGAAAAGGGGGGVFGASAGPLARAGRKRGRGE